MTDIAREPVDFSAAKLRTMPGYRAIVDLIRREVSLGRLQAGDRLPPERKLADQLGVSRETVRQALRVLEGSAEVEIMRGAAGGPVVRESVVDPAVVRAELVARADEITALADYRSIIEGAAASAAAALRTEDDLARLETAQARLRDAATLAESRAADTAFHLAIAAMSRNPFLTAAIEDARAQMFTPVDVLSFRFVKHTSLDAHARVIDAIRAADGPGADAAMRAHVHTTREEFDRVLSDDLAADGP